MKKSNISDFFVKINADHLSSSADFSKPVLWKGFEIKSHKRELIIPRPHTALFMCQVEYNAIGISAIDYWAYTSNSAIRV